MSQESFENMEDPKKKLFISPPLSTINYADPFLNHWIDATNNALAVRIIIAINVVIFLAMVVASYGSALFAPPINFIIRWGANIGSYTLIDEPIRLITYAFLHGNLFHILMNMFILFDVGPLVEKIFGTRRFLFIYFFSAIIAALNSLFWRPVVVSIGASGAVFGVYGALLAFYLSHKSAFPKRFIQEKSRFVLAFIICNLLYGLLQPNIDNASHIGGLVGGFVIGIILCPVAPRKHKWRWQKLIGLISLAIISYGFFSLDKLALLDKHGRLSWQTALRYMAEDNYHQALFYFNKYINTYNNKTALAYLLQAECMEREKNYTSALANIETAIKLDPENKEAQLMRLHITQLMQGKIK